MILRLTKWILIWLGITVVLLAVMTSSGCGAMGAKYSEDPNIAMKQVFVAQCQQMRQFMNTAYQLRAALKEGEKVVVDKIDAIYRPICEGEPLPLTDALKDAAAKLAAQELCPELEVMGGDVIITIAQAATCAARKALIMNLENQS